MKPRQEGLRDCRGGGVGKATALPFFVGIYFLKLPMARKCKINGETLTLMFDSICQILKSYHFKMVSTVPEGG